MLYEREERLLAAEARITSQHLEVHRLRNQLEASATLLPLARLLAPSFSFAFPAIYFACPALAFTHGRPTLPRAQSRDKDIAYVHRLLERARADAGRMQASSILVS
jgi:hypothetical protein